VANAVLGITAQRSLVDSIMPQPTTAQSLGSLLKSARDIMRKDKGLKGDFGCQPDRINRMDRIPEWKNRN
jgi:hypothetical protein